MSLDAHAVRKASGRGPSSPVVPEEMSQALHEVMSLPWVEVATMATVLGIGLRGAYREAQAGRFGAFRVGSLYRVPSRPLREVLGLKTELTTPQHEAA